MQSTALSPGASPRTNGRTLWIRILSLLLSLSRYLRMLLLLLLRLPTPVLVADLLGALIIADALPQELVPAHAAPGRRPAHARANLVPRQRRVDLDELDQARVFGGRPARARAGAFGRAGGGGGRGRGRRRGASCCGGGGRRVWKGIIRRRRRRRSGSARPERSLADQLEVVDLRVRLLDRALSWRASSSLLLVLLLVLGCTVSKRRAGALRALDRVVQERLDRLLRLVLVRLRLRLLRPWPCASSVERIASVGRRRQADLERVGQERSAVALLVAVRRAAIRGCCRERERERERGQCVNPLRAAER